MDFILEVLGYVFYGWLWLFSSAFREHEKAVWRSAPFWIKVGMVLEWLISIIIWVGAIVWFVYWLVG